MSETNLLLIGVIALIFLTGLALYFLQQALIFSPTHYRRSFYSEHSRNYRLIRHTLKDGTRIEGIHYEPVEPAATILFFGGREHDSVALMTRLSQHYPACRMIAFNYRGYGHSEGKPTGNRILGDAVELYDRYECDYGHISVMGYSLGTFVASHVAASRHVDNVFLISPFPSLTTLLKARKVPLAEWMLQCRFNTAELLPNIFAPVYIFFSKDDRTIPCEQVRSLLPLPGNLAGSKELSGYNHAQLLFSDEVVSAINTVLCRTSG
jgi:pimeloyl-ACP methyl ester carboxylesterase